VRDFILVARNLIDIPRFRTALSRHVFVTMPVEEAGCALVTAKIMLSFAQAAGVEGRLLSSSRMAAPGAVA